MEGCEKTISDMSDQMSAVAFGDTIEQNQEMEKQAVNHNSGGSAGQEVVTNDLCDGAHTGDTDLDMAMDLDSDECKDADAETRSQQRAIWDVLEPSEANLNKLDGWSPKGSVGSTGCSDIDTSSVTALENWLKENLPDDYGSTENLSVDKERSDRRKSRVRWADVETQLQGLGVTLQPGLEPSTGGSQT